MNAQRYRDEILRPIVNNARPHVARIYTQFLEAENIPVLAWPAYSPDMSPIEHVWDALDRRIRQQGSTVRAFHSHLRQKIDVCELENVFSSMSANTIQNSLTYTVAYNKRINLFSLFMEK